jgi:uncharacterized protein (TIGR02284 family)
MPSLKVVRNGALIKSKLMNSISTGRRITSSQGAGEVLTTFDDKVVIKLDNGETTTLPADMVEADTDDTPVETYLSDELPEQAEARAEHANQIVARLDELSENKTNENQIPQQNPMEISEKTIDALNDLIEMNNDRVEGFEKAGRDLEEQYGNLTLLFEKLAGESRQNVVELTDIVQQYGGEPAEGTSTSGDLHRAWIDVKSVFTGGDAEAVLNECERGEDAIKAAYQSALSEDSDLSPELLPILQKQQMGVNEGHDQIKSLRDQLSSDNMTDENDAAEEGEEDDDYNGLNNAGPINGSVTTEPTAYGEQETAKEPSFGEGAIATEPSYEGAAGEYGQQTDFTPRADFAPEPESIEQEEAWNEEGVTTTGNSKLMEFFVDELKDLLWAERELVDTLPDMAEAATSQELKTAFTNHLAETEVHVSRLEQIFGILGLEPDTTKCDAMAGIVEEGDGIISHTEEGTAQRDVGLIFAGQKAEHYEIASYGGMISLAKTLGYYDIAELLVLTIDEEKSADALLTEIAENHVNYEASTEPSED